MNTVRGVLIALLAAGLTLFAVGNNSHVNVDLGIRELEVWLPLLVLVAFLLGLLPVWLRLSADRLVLRRKLAKAEATQARTETDLAQARVELLRPPGAAAAPVAEPYSGQTVPHPAPPPGT